MSTIEINVQAQVDGAVADLKKIPEALNDTSAAADKSTFSFTELNQALEVGQKVVRMLGDAYNATIAPTLAYTDQVRELSRTIGSSTEDASKLIQAADDVFVSFDSLTQGMSAAIRKGFEPTIAGLGQMSDQYLAIQDPIQRAKYLMDTFGRSGADLAPLMEKGSAGIVAMGQAASDAGQVMSGEAVQAAQDYKIAIDGLTDSWQGFIYTISNDAIPTLTKVVDGVNQHIELVRLENAAIAAGIPINEELAMAHTGVQNRVAAEAAAIESLRAKLGATDSLQKGNITTLQGLSIATDQAANSFMSLANIQDIATGRSTALNQAFAEMSLELAGPLGQETDNYNNSIEGLTDKQAKLSAEIEKYTGLQGAIIPPSADLAELQNQQALAADRYTQATQNLGDAQNNLIPSSDAIVSSQHQQALAADNYARAVKTLSDAQAAAGTETTTAVLKAQVAVDSAAAALGKYNNTSGQLTTSMLQAKVAVDSSRDALDALNKKVSDADGGMADYSAKLKALQKDYDTNKEALEKLALKHEDETRRVVAGLMEQKLQTDIASGAITKEMAPAAIAALDSVLVSWGILDEGTATASEAIDAAIAKLVTGGSIDDFEDALYGIGHAATDAFVEGGKKNKTSADELDNGLKVGAIPTLAKFGTKLDTDLPASALVADTAVEGFGDQLDLQMGPDGAIILYTIGLTGITAEYNALATAARGVPALPAPNSSSSHDERGPGGASGLDFVVPPGYPNDSYPMRVQSGEHVTVTPAGQPSGGNTINLYAANDVDYMLLARQVAQILATG